LNTFESYNDLDIAAPLKAALQEMKFLTPTPIQAKAIPAGLSGKDVVGTAQTGTGKTGAFAVPMLNFLYKNPGKNGLILAPTRELAAQIHKVMRTMSKGSKLRGTLVVGGESFPRQVREIRDGADYIIATPGRLNDHLQQRTIKLGNVAVFVLDEVDRMLDMGFLPQIKEVLTQVPVKRHTMLFSATLPSDVQRFVDKLVTEPIRISVGDGAKPNVLVKETIKVVQPGEKTRLIVEELKAREGKTLIFMRTKARTERTLRLLEREGMYVVLLHGGRSQGQRKHALEDFRANKNAVMIATDLAGRGLDVVDIDTVINYDAPSTREDYIHRIGRTGRAGATGEAITFIEAGNREEEMIVTGKRPEKVQRGPKGRDAGQPFQPFRASRGERFQTKNAEAELANPTPKTEGKARFDSDRPKAQFDSDRPKAQLDNDRPKARFDSDKGPRRPFRNDSRSEGPAPKRPAFRTDSRPWQAERPKRFDRSAGRPQSGDARPHTATRYRADRPEPRAGEGQRPEKRAWTPKRPPFRGSSGAPIRRQARWDAPRQPDSFERKMEPAEFKVFDQMGRPNKPLSRGPKKPNGFGKRPFNKAGFNRGPARGPGQRGGFKSSRPSGHTSRQASSK